MIVKDPNKPILRLYDIPDGTFESEEESGESEEGEGLNFSGYLVQSSVMSILAGLLLEESRETKSTIVDHYIFNIFVLLSRY